MEQAAIIAGMHTTHTLLGKLSAEEFLHDYWQKKPLLIRQAIPQFDDLLTQQQIMSLACTETAQARLITRQRGKFALRHAPLMARDFKTLAGKSWTVLVQDINHHLPAAMQLLKQFNFIPHARLDDLMVSYATKGGGVGPHFDSYDVFLLQGSGQRRWQISGQQDHELIKNLPLRILKNFKAEQEWVLEAGDMLYLPPHYAHNGIAENDCITYSIGFRAPGYQELAEQFLVYLQDRINLDGIYTDPDLARQAHPAEISAAMLRQAGQVIKNIRWDKEDIANFLGCYLSEPKVHVFFGAPEHPLSLTQFRLAIKKNGVALDLKSQLLCHGTSLFMNGEAFQVGAAIYPLLRELADRRELPALTSCPAELTALLYQWYLDGYIVLVGIEVRHE
jgi:50S ribosomal protein L16 3-hydroxylase